MMYVLAFVCTLEAILFIQSGLSFEPPRPGLRELKFPRPNQRNLPRLDLKPLKPKKTPLNPLPNQRDSSPKKTSFKPLPRLDLKPLNPKKTPLIPLPNQRNSIFKKQSFNPLPRLDLKPLNDKTPPSNTLERLPKKDISNADKTKSRQPTSRENDFKSVNNELLSVTSSKSSNKKEETVPMDSASPKGNAFNENPEYDSTDVEEQIEGRGLLTPKKEYENLWAKRCQAGCKDKRKACQIVKQKGKCKDLSRRQLRKCACSCLNCQRVSSLYQIPKKTKLRGKVEYNSKSCGDRTRELVVSIIEGQQAKRGNWPWIVGLIEVDDGLPYKKRLTKPTFCGGTLINPRTVITAAHCFEPYPLIRADTLNVRLADQQVNKIEVGEEVVEVERIIRHNAWNNKTYEHDIAMLILKKDINTDTHTFMNTACLPISSSIPSDYCLVAGWGVQKDDSTTQAKTLMQIEIPVVTNKRCNRGFRRGAPVKEGMMCAGSRGNRRDACQGDSGGPLVCRKDRKYELRGIVSWGEGCGRRGKYGVYTNVWKYMDWIKDKMAFKLML